MKTLVLGGYGNFGARICRALAGGNLEVIAAGRDPDGGHERAGFDSRIGKARLDIFSPDLAREIASLAPDIVIHCVGPFQGQDYRVAESVVAAKAHYVDLADGRAFVTTFQSHLNSQAMKAGVLAVSGASTLPALSSAVLDSLVERFTSMEDIQISIAPAQRTPRGAATLAAVFSYLGRPFTWLEKGEWQTVHGWQALRRYRFTKLGRRWAAACDVPDLELLPSRYPGVKTLQFRAALEFSLEHFLLAGLAQLRSWGLPIAIEKYAPLVDRVASWLNPFAGQFGGMLVRVQGVDRNGQRSGVEWQLTADYRQGPEIPCMAAIVLARKLAEGKITARGAMPCIGLLNLDDFKGEFARCNVQTSVDTVSQ